MTEPSKDDDLVIRPAGVWDTRSPLIQFNRRNHELNQSYYSTLLAVTSLQSSARTFDPTTAATQLFPHRKSHSVANRVWRAFKKSFPSDFDGSRPSLTVESVIDSTRLSIAAITEHAIVKNVALFETFAQCWALNYLLARLESGDLLSKRERRLASAFSPVNNRRVPGCPEIFAAIPCIQEALAKVPHLKTHPHTGDSIEDPLTSQLDAFTVIGFWREWRNQLIHRSGIVSTWFFNKHGPVWDDMQDLSPTNKELEKGRRLPLDDSAFRAVTAVHSQAARKLRDILVTVSGERCGHVLAPKSVWNKGRMPSEMLPESLPLMLMRGDHEPSLLWATDDAYRRRKLHQLKA